MKHTVLATFRYSFLKQEHMMLVCSDENGNRMFVDYRGGPVGFIDPNLKVPDDITSLEQYSIVLSDEPDARTERTFYRVRDRREFNANESPVYEKPWGTKNLVGHIHVAPIVRPSRSR